MKCGERASEIRTKKNNSNKGRGPSGPAMSHLKTVRHYCACVPNCAAAPYLTQSAVH